MRSSPEGAHQRLAEKTYLIVNADDFGMSAGVNRGIIRAHEHGIVTSASLMVRRAGAAQAAAYARNHPSLSLGLHFDLWQRVYRENRRITLYELVRSEDSAAVAEELSCQVAIFRQLVGRDPTHLDSHQNAHRKVTVGPALAAVACQFGVPLRACNTDVRFCSDFYGQGPRGVPIPGALSVERLILILASLTPGITELMCHPGDGRDLPSYYMYRDERAQEVNTLCDPTIRASISAHGIELRSFHADPGQRWTPSRYELCLTRLPSRRR
jgi:predicted glycoside hydrolase/deacetylase ChbG (UPF0249 family)